LKNPELAYNFLYSIDNRAAAAAGLNPFINSGGGFKTAATPFNQSQQQKVIIIRKIIKEYFLVISK
jgi:hypothetical protein